MQNQVQNNLCFNKKADKQVAEALSIELEEKVICIKRLRLIDEVPVILKLIILE